MPVTSATDYYEFLVVGSNPGGVACAREASLAGKKTAIVRWKTYTPAEKEGFDESLDEMAEALDVDLSKTDNLESNDQLSNDNFLFLAKKQKKDGPKNKRMSIYSAKNLRWSKKVRRSRLDLMNILFKRAHQGRKLMHNAVLLNNAVDQARNSGWRLTSVIPPITLNWHKMSEQVMDYFMEENWKLRKELEEGGVEIIEGTVKFITENKLLVTLENSTDREISAELICLAPSAEFRFPIHVGGATEFGINCDDFVRLSESPGKTLVVGALPEGLECAGIIARSGAQVVVVTRSRILKNFDTEIVKMIVTNLKSVGVVFLEKTLLRSVKLNNLGKLVAKFVPVTGSEDTIEEHDEIKKSKEEEFDTVLFATGTHVFLDHLHLSNAGIHIDQENHLIHTNEREETSVHNIYAVGDVVSGRPQGLEISDLAGRLLGQRLFHEKTDLMDYSMYPTVIYTPMEYAFVGISEDSALNRFGQDCIEVYYGFFKPLDFVIPPQKERCFVKIVVLKLNDKVIGLHLFGPEAGETIQGFVAAIKFGISMAQLRTVIGVEASRAQEVLKLKEMKPKKPNNSET